MSKSRMFMVSKMSLPYSASTSTSASQYPCYRCGQILKSLWSTMDNICISIYCLKTREKIMRLWLYLHNNVSASFTSDKETKWPKEKYTMKINFLSNSISHARKMHHQHPSSDYLVCDSSTLSHMKSLDKRWKRFPNHSTIQDSTKF